MPTRSWQKDLDRAEAMKEQARLNAEPQPYINVAVMIEQFLDQRGSEFANGLDAAKAIIPVARQRLADLGYAPRPMNWLPLEIETIAAFNRRAQLVETDRERRANWLSDFQAGARS